MSMGYVVKRRYATLNKHKESRNLCLKKDKQRLVYKEMICS